MEKATQESDPTAGLTWRRVYGLATGVLSILGLAVVLALALPSARDRVLGHVQWMPWKLDMTAWMRPQRRAGAGLGEGVLHEVPEFSGAGMRARAEPVRQIVLGALPGEAEPAGARERLAVTEFVARRYRVADEVVGRFVAIAYRASERMAVDPLLVLAVVATESRYNPIAESVVGAKGLMQVIAKFHPEKIDKFGGENALLDPEVNIVVGTQILREYLKRFGDVETALQMYAGAFDEPTSQYARKVLAERARLYQVVSRLRREA